MKITLKKVQVQSADLAGEESEVGFQLFDVKSFAFNVNVKHNSTKSIALYILHSTVVCGVR